MIELANVKRGRGGGVGSLGGAGSRTSRVRFISAGVGGDIGVHGRLGGIATVDVGVCEIRGELVNSAGSGSSSHFFSGNDEKKTELLIAS